jgi:hypothetical protein
MLKYPCFPSKGAATYSTTTPLAEVYLGGIHSALTSLQHLRS